MLSTLSKTLGKETCSFLNMFHGFRPKSLTVEAPLPRRLPRSS